MQKKYHTTVYVDKNKPRINIYADTKKELDRRIREIKDSVDQGDYRAESGLFKLWAEKWITEKKKPQLDAGNIKPQTFDACRSCLNHLVNEFDNKKIEKITLSEMQLFVNQLAQKNKNTGKPTARKTIKDILTIWDNITHFAELNNVKVPKFRKKDIGNNGREASKRYAITLEEQNMIIDTYHRAQLPAMLMLFAGLRKSEAGALRWEHIDLEHRIINIKQAVTFSSCGQPKVTKGGKTYNAIRQIPICPILYEYLKQYKKKHKCKSGFLVLNQNGDLLSKTSWRSLWDSYLDDLNIKYGLNNQVSKYRNSKYPFLIRRFTPHWLRHTFATILYLQRFDALQMKAILGHSDIRTSVNTYTDMQNFNIYTISEEYKKRLENEYKVPKEL